MYKIPDEIIKLLDVDCDLTDATLEQARFIMVGVLQNAEAEAATSSRLLREARAKVALLDALLVLRGPAP